MIFNLVASPGFSGFLPFRIVRSEEDSGTDRLPATPGGAPSDAPVLAGEPRKIARQAWLLDLTESEYRDVLAGRRPLGGRTGPKALAAALGRIDLGRAMADARDQFKARSGASRDLAARKLRYLRQAKQSGVHPKDWVTAKVPVLPPRFRPISQLAGSDAPVVADANVLYKELFAAKENLASLQGLTDDVGDDRLAVYDAYKAVVGLGDPIQPRTREKEVKGLLHQVFGRSPKHSHVQRKLLASQVDLVGRSVIGPDAKLGLDQAGIPEATAWDVYKKFVVRRLRRDGMPLNEAVRRVKDKDERARRALVSEMDARPVIIDRAPVLHRYGTMAFRPLLVPGSTLRLNPLVTAGFGADFDGPYASPVRQADVLHQPALPAEEGRR